MKKASKLIKAKRNPTEGIAMKKLNKRPKRAKPARTRLTKTNYAALLRAVSK